MDTETMKQREPRMVYYGEFRSHFIMRLKERYSIEISEGEYDELVNELPGYDFCYKLSGSVQICWITIKGSPVLCIFSKTNILDKNNERLKFNKLSTCLNIGGEMKCPQYLIRSGYDKGKFESDVNEIIKEVTELSEVLKLQGEKTFFTTNESSTHMKHAAKRFLRSGYPTISCVISELCHRNNVPQSRNETRYPTHAPTKSRQRDIKKIKSI